MILQSVGIGVISILFPTAYVSLPALFLTEVIDRGLAKIMGIFVGLCLLLEALVLRMGIVLFTLSGPLVLISHYCLVVGKDLVTSPTLSSGPSMVPILAVLETTEVLASIQKDDFPQKFIEMQKRAGVWQDSMIQYIPTFRPMMRQVAQYLPVILIILSLTVTYITLASTGKELLLRGKLVVQPPPLFYFKLPQGVFVVLGAVILVSLVFQTQVNESAPLLANNGLVLTASLFFIQGLAVVDFFSLKLGISCLPKAILLTMIIFTPLMQVPAACLGPLDSLLNPRRIHLK